MGAEQPPMFKVSSDSAITRSNKAELLAYIMRTKNYSNE